MMCSPHTKALLTSLTSFPTLSLKVSTVSDRSHKEELKASCLCKKREKDTRSYCKAQIKLNSCKHSCTEHIGLFTLVRKTELAFCVTLNLKYHGLLHPAMSPLSLFTG